MSGAKNCPETPRQKMIGMMYLVLTAMLALNVSADILNGFKMVNDSLRNTLETAEIRNEALYGSFRDLANLNPDKVGDWLNKANSVKVKSDSLYKYIEQIKVDIAKVADGEDGSPDSLKNASNTDATGQIGLTEGRGVVLKGMMDDYSEFLQGVIDEPTLKAQFAKVFDTSSKRDPKTNEMRKFEFQLFDYMPAAATVALLSKTQNDIRNSEAEIVNYLKLQIDAGDFRVNKIEAKVIPVSNYVIKGGKYSAQIVLTAIDSTARPKIMVNGRDLQNEKGMYEVPASSVGSHKYSGQIILDRDGVPVPYNFSSEYTVGEPSVTVSADLMNVFYAGFDNPVSISVPGVPQDKINASASSGALTRKGNGWTIKPTKIGQDINITVTATIEGRVQTFGAKTFRVKALPPPVAFIEYKDDKGNTIKYKGGKPLSKASLLSAAGLKAELDDADLDVKYRVISFELNVMGTMDTSVDLSDGPRFSERQMAKFRTLTKGKKVFLSRIKAMGPDMREQDLPPIEVIIQ